MKTDAEPKIPARSTHPTLAAALIACQAACWSITRDGRNTHDGFDYTTADNAAEYARKMLTAFGLCWTRTSITMLEPRLASSEIGAMDYVGDVAISWALRHEGGEVVEGRSEYPIITSRRRPHEKAAQASITYGCGQILLGLLCLDREDKNASVDGRADDVPEPEPQRPAPKPAPKSAPANREPAPARTGKAPAKPPTNGKADDVQDGDYPGPYCTGAASGIAKAIRERGAELVALAGKGATLASIYKWAWGVAEVPALPSGTPREPEQLSVPHGSKVKELITTERDRLRAVGAKHARPQRGDDEREFDGGDERDLVGEIGDR